MKLDDLKSKFSDFLRPSLYAVYMFPKKNFASYVNAGIAVLCNSTSFPFYTFNTVDSKYNNKEYYAATKIDYDPVSFSFYIDKQNIVLEFFDAWKKQIIDEDHRFGYPDDYTAQVDIELIDTRDDTAVIASLMDAFPINVNPISLSYSESDSIINMEVSFKFNDIVYEFIPREKQKPSNVIVNPKTWKDYLTVGNIRRGVNMISKVKNYRYLVKNGGAYDIIKHGSNAFPGVNKTTNVSSGKSIVSKASKLFK